MAGSLTGILFLMGFTGGLLAALFRNPLYGLYTYVAVFYLHPPHRWWGIVLPDVRWSLVASVVTLIATWRLAARPDRNSWLSGSGPKIMILFLVWFWIQTAWALDRPLHIEAATIFTKYIVLFFCIYKLLDNKEAIHGFCAAHVLGCLFLGWLVFVSPNTGRLDGIGGPGINSANSLSMQLTTGLCFAGFLLLRGKLSYRLIAIIATPLLGNAFIQAQTRGALFGLVAGGCAMMYLMPRGNRKLGYVAAVIAIVAMFQMAPDNFWRRMDSIAVAFESVTGVEIMKIADDQGSTIDDSAQSRVELLKAQWEMFKSYPHGTGHRGTAVLSPQYLEARHLTIGGRSSHNTVMTVLVEQGVIGIILLMIFFIWTYRSLRNLKALDKQGFPVDMGVFRAMIGGSLISIFVAGMFADFLKVEVQVWCIALLAVLLDQARRWQESPEPGPDSGGRHGSEFGALDSLSK